MMGTSSADKTWSEAIYVETDLIVGSALTARFGDLQSEPHFRGIVIVVVAFVLIDNDGVVIHRRNINIFNAARIVGGVGH